LSGQFRWMLMGGIVLHPHGPATDSRIRRSAFFVLSLFAFFSSLLCSGCMVLPAAKTKSPIGASGVPPGKLDLKFIQPGSTQRAEIFERLSALDSGCSNNQFFWGRWSTRSVDVVWVSSNVPESWPGTVHGYSIHNLLVEFDSQGVVQSSRVIPDDKIIAELHALQVKTNTPPTDFSKPLSFPVEFTSWQRGIISAPAQSGTIVLSQEFFQFIEEGTGKYNFTVPRSSLGQIKHDQYGSDNQDPGLIFAILHFNQTTPFGQDLHVSLALNDLIALLQFSSQ
jgi:hypothetical protein